MVRLGYHPTCKNGSQTIFTPKIPPRYAPKREDEMQLKKTDEWQFFRKSSGQRAYHPKCLHCLKTCKQGFRAVLVFCPNFKKRR